MQLKTYANLRDDFANWRLETHVEHAIGLVENKIRAALHIRFAGFEKVKQTAGRRKADVDAGV